MKSKTKSKTKKADSQRVSSRSRRTREPKENIEDRDLNEDDQKQITNEDEQKQITNVDRDDDMASTPDNSSRNSGFTVEEEEEREKRRQVEDLHPEEPMK